MKRTLKKDLLESQAIADNTRVIQTGGFATHVFEFEGMIISDPYFELSGRFEVIPYDYYGKAYEKWYNELDK